MYRFFYGFDHGPDCFMVMIRPDLMPDKTERHGDVAALYKDGNLIGANMFGFSKKAKTKSRGVIFAPSAELVGLVSDILEGAGLPRLDPKAPSGAIAAKVLRREEHPLDAKLYIYSLDLGGKTVSSVSSFKVEEGELLAVLLSENITWDGEYFIAHKERNIPIDVLLVPADVFDKDKEGALILHEKTLGEEACI